MTIITSPTEAQYSLLPLCERQDLNKKCIELLNEEWPRSDGSREHSQAKSCRPTPPMSLLLIENETDRLVGHSRVCHLPARPTACWIESVIVARSERGKGLGKLLMIMTEKFVAQFGFDQAYLCTDDQCVFYTRCGYVECKPVVHSTTATTVFPSWAKDPEPTPSPEKVAPEAAKVEAPSVTSDSVVTSSAAPPPPPPPPPPPAVAKVSASTQTSSIHLLDHQYMHKKFV